MIRVAASDFSLRRQSAARLRMVSYEAMWYHGQEGVDVPLHRQKSPEDSEGRRAERFEGG